MQLSLPIPVLPAPPVSTGGNKNPAAADPGSRNPADTAADSFESLLSQDASAESSDDEEQGPDTEKMADILAASFWMPMAPVTTPPPAAVLTADAIDAAPQSTEQPGDALQNNEAPATGMKNSQPGICFGFQSVRSFGPAVPAAGAPRGQAQEKIRGAGTPEQVESEESALAAQPDVGQSPVAVQSRPASLVANMQMAKMPATNMPVVPVQVAPVATKLPAKGVAVDSNFAVTATGEAKVEEGATPNPVPIVPAQADLPAAKQTSTQEKFAVPPPPLDNQPVPVKQGREKYFLEAAHKAITAVGNAVGIAVAKVAPIMSAVATRTKETPLDEATSAFTFSGESTPVATLTPDAPAPVATVRETMAAVISAVDTLERRADVEHKMVDLQFHVGTERLGLRVELRDGVVHTTFHTESSEMNRALSREWHMVVQSGAASEIRVAEPVFNSSGSHGHSASGSPGQGTPQHREQQQARPSFSSALKNEFYESAVASTATSAAPAANSSQLLNVLA